MSVTSLFVRMPSADNPFMYRQAHRNRTGVTECALFADKTLQDAHERPAIPRRQTDDLPVCLKRAAVDLFEEGHTCLCQSNKPCSGLMRTAT